MTTFTDREVPSDALAALAVATNAWENVFTYVPKVTTLALSHPNLIIVSDGDETDMVSANMNPVDFYFILSTWVIARRASDNYTNENAETQLNALNRTLRQLIRDNTVITNKWDDIQFEGRSRVERTIFEGTAFIVETRTIRVHLASGQVSP